MNHLRTKLEVPSFEWKRILKVWQYSSNIYSRWLQWNIYWKMALQEYNRTSEMTSSKYHRCNLSPFTRRRQTEDTPFEISPYWSKIWLLSLNDLRLKENKRGSIERNSTQEVVATKETRSRNIAGGQVVVAIAKEGDMVDTAKTKNLAQYSEMLSKGSVESQLAWVLTSHLVLLQWVGKETKLPATNNNTKAAKWWVLEVIAIKDIWAPALQVVLITIHQEARVIRQIHLSIIAGTRQNNGDQALNINLWEPITQRSQKKKMKKWSLKK